MSNCALVSQPVNSLSDQSFRQSWDHSETSPRMHLRFMYWRLLCASLAGRSWGANLQCYSNKTNNNNICDLPLVNGVWWRRRQRVTLATAMEVVGILSVRCRPPTGCCMCACVFYKTYASCCFCCAHNRQIFTDSQSTKRVLFARLRVGVLFTAHAYTHTPLQ